MLCLEELFLAVSVIVITWRPRRATAQARLLYPLDEYRILYEGDSHSVTPLVSI